MIQTQGNKLIQVTTLKKNKRKEKRRVTIN